jgi:hypothetical protein
MGNARRTVKNVEDQRKFSPSLTPSECVTMESNVASVENVEGVVYVNMGLASDSASLVADQRKWRKGANVFRICVHSKVKYYCKDCKIAKEALIAATALLNSSPLLL